MSDNAKRWITLAYLTLASLTFGYTWQRDCFFTWRDTKEQDPAASFVCSTFLGGAWPVYWSIKNSIWLTSPERQWSLPSINWNITWKELYDR